MVAALAEDGYQSDERFTEGFVRQRMAQCYGPAKIRAELRGRGVEAGLIDGHLGVASSEQWRQQAVQALRRRHGSAPPEDFKDRARRWRFLAQRGFDHATIDSALNTPIEDENC